MSIASVNGHSPASNHLTAADTLGADRLVGSKRRSGGVRGLHNGATRTKRSRRAAVDIDGLSAAETRLPPAVQIDATSLHNPESQTSDAGRVKTEGGHRSLLPQVQDAAESVSTAEVVKTSAVIRELAKLRRSHMKLRQSVINQIKGYTRSALGFNASADEKARKEIRELAGKIADAVIDGKPTADFDPLVVANVIAFARPYASALQSQHDEINELTKQMTTIAATLPVAAWVKSVKGFGFGNLALIVGECGDLGNYSTPAKVWKRMGLAVINGVAQGKLPKGSPKELWIEHGYNKERRSVAWNLGQCLIKKDNAYRALYDERRVIEDARCETPMAAFRRAQRYVEKRAIRDLWVRWNKPGSPMPNPLESHLPPLATAAAA